MPFNLIDNQPVAYMNYAHTDHHTNISHDTQTCELTYISSMLFRQTVGAVFSWWESKRERAWTFPFRAIANVILFLILFENVFKIYGFQCWFWRAGCVFKIYGSQCWFWRFRRAGGSGELEVCERKDLVVFLVSMWYWSDHFTLLLVLIQCRQCCSSSVTRCVKSINRECCSTTASPSGSQLRTGSYSCDTKWRKQRGTT